MRLLYFSQSASGGLAEYAHYQANALADVGADVAMLGPATFEDRADRRYRTATPLAGEPQSSRLAFARRMLSNVSSLARRITEERYDRVLMGSYVEYLAPLWSYKLERLANEGVVFGAVIHDPVRDFIVGPAWWHRWSVASGYSFLREAFLHEQTALDTVRSLPRLRTTVVPHGPYGSVAPTQSREAVRAALGIPSDAPIMLAFGHIRDGKNLDLVLRAMVELPRVYLIVAGKEQSSGQKPAAHYQQRANELGVANRCRWLIDYIPDAEVANLFTASDLVLLSYSTAFHSASGVQNMAATYRRLSVVSAGTGNLRSVVDHYNLGVLVEPDDIPDLRRGILEGLESPPPARWDDYLHDNSWQKNAELVLEAFRDRGD
jgi:glycosyltransferase involved in cell wall biosynthesis